MAAPLLAYACHCHDCQTRSGSAFALTVVARSADVAVEGQPAVLRLTSPSGREVEHTTCPACAVRLFVRGAEAPEFTSLRAGTLDDASWVMPVAQTWVESALPWAVIPGVRNVPSAEFDFAALAREWRASAPVFAVG
jgi:hypothetical protein